MSTNSINDFFPFFLKNFFYLVRKFFRTPGNPKIQFSRKNRILFISAFAINGPPLSFAVILLCTPNHAIRCTQHLDAFWGGGFFHYGSRRLRENWIPNYPKIGNNLHGRKNIFCLISVDNYSAKCVGVTSSLPAMDILFVPCTIVCLAESYVCLRGTRVDDCHQCGSLKVCRPWDLRITLPTREWLTARLDLGQLYQAAANIFAHLPFLRIFCRV